MTVRKQIHDEECYPVYFLDDPPPGHPDWGIDIPDELWAEYIAADAAFTAVQDKLAELEGRRLGS